LTQEALEHLAAALSDAVAGRAWTMCFSSKFEDGRELHIFFDTLQDVRFFLWEDHTRRRLLATYRIDGVPMLRHLLADLLSAVKEDIGTPS